MEEKKKSGFFKNWIVKNLLGALVFVVVLIVAVSILLNVLTRHGKTVRVPDFTNMSVPEAVQAAQKGGVHVKVTDSVFVRRLGAGVVYRQSPKAGAEVKQGRNIFLTINSIVPRKTVMPNLVGYSFIEAKAELTNRGLNLGKIRYVNDMATNNVLKQQYRGREIAAGAEIVSGSDIDLVLGLSREDSKTAVPDVVGMRMIQAVDVLHDRFLNVGRMTFDPGIHNYRDSVNAVVYRQDTPGVQKTLGSSVNLYLTLDQAKVPAK